MALSPNGPANINPIPAAPKVQPPATQLPATLPMAAAPTAPPADTTPSIPTAPQMAPAPAAPAADTTPSIPGQQASQLHPLATAAPSTVPPSSGPTFPGPRPVANASNWQNWDANNAAWEQSVNAWQTANSAKAPPGATQEDLNRLNGMVLNPGTGAWDYPTAAPDPSMPQSGEQFTLGPGGQYQNIQRNGQWQQANGSPLPAGQDQYGMSTFTGTGMQPSSTNGVANPNAGLPIAPPPHAADATPSIPSAAPTLAPAPNAPADAQGSIPIAAPALAGPASGPGAGVGLGTQDLTNSTIQPGAGLDRVALAQQLMANLRAQSEPQWQKTQRDLTQNAAANGQTGSGMFRTSLGDAARQHELDLQNGDLGFLSNALNGSVDDQYKNIGIAQQQQGFQAGQQQTAFSQAVVQAQVEEALRQGDFSRAMQLLQAGNAGNPSDTALALAGNYGQQATGAAQGAAGLVAGAAGNRNGPYDAFIKQLLAGGAPTSTLPVAQDPVYGDG